LTRIHQVLSGAGPVDAVTQQAFEYRRAFQAWGMEGGVHAAAIEPAVRSQVEPLKRLEPAPDDLLLFHYSAYAPRLEPLLDWPQRKLLVVPQRHSRGVAVGAPAARSDVCARWAAITCRAGRRASTLPLRCPSTTRASCARPERARRAWCRSWSTPTALRSACRCAVRDGNPEILSVGRLAPHKRPDLVLRAFELYRTSCAPDAHLHMVGEPLSPAYGAELRELAGDRVTLHGRLGQGELNGLWRDAGVFLTLSAHEGFCVPLLEAFLTDTPVVARPVGGMPEVGGDAVLWTEDRDLAVVAELIDLAVRDDELRRELIARGRGARSGVLAGARDPAVARSGGRNGGFEQQHVWVRAVTVPLPPNAGAAARSTFAVHSTHDVDLAGQATPRRVPRPLRPPLLTCRRSSE